MSYLRDKNSESKLIEFNKRIELLNEKIPNEDLRFSTLITFYDNKIKIEITNAKLQEDIKMEIMKIFHEVFPKIDF
jgi:hypothetical protein